MVERLRVAAGLFPLTTTGFTALVLSTGALVFVGIQRVDHVLLVAGVAGLLLVFAALVLTVIGALWVHHAVRGASQPPIRLVAGNPGPTGFTFAHPLFLPLLDVRWSVEAPDVGLRLVPRGRTLHEHWIPARRGEPTDVHRVFRVGDAFGLCAVDLHFHTEADVRVLPDEGSLRRVEVIQGLAAGDQIPHPEGAPVGDLQDMRQYGAGDPIRYVLWKVFAKSRTLMVRTPERALAPVTRTAAYLVAGPDDQAATGTAKTAVECGALGSEWVFGCDGTTGGITQSRDLLGLLLASADHPSERSGDGLASFLASFPDARRVVVFAPALPGPWVQRLLAVARHTPLQVILCADHIEPGNAGFHVGRLVFRPGDPAPPGRVTVDRPTLGSLAASLAGVGEIRIVDRQTGAVYAGAHIRNLVKGAA